MKNICRQCACCPTTSCTRSSSWCCGSGTWWWWWPRWGTSCTGSPCCCCPRYAPPSPCSCGQVSSTTSLARPGLCWQRVPPSTTCCATVLFVSVMSGIRAHNSNTFCTQQLQFCLSTIAQLQIKIISKYLMPFKSGCLSISPVFSRLQNMKSMRPHRPVYS